MDSLLYHILNRGVDKRTLFLDEQDRFRFIHDLFEFNDALNTTTNNYRFHKSLDIGCPEMRRSRTLLVKLHAFCLMPNHYHLLISPFSENGVPRFMQKLNMGYAKYFNEKYKRSGALFQGKYKSVPVTNEHHGDLILYYIHFNPLDLSTPSWRKRSLKNAREAVSFLSSYRWSSHLDYIGEHNFPSVTQKDWMLQMFGGERGYKKSVTSVLKNFSDESVAHMSLE